jgi:uncharacterized repeat protein (TIGR01451 family)
MKEQTQLNRTRWTVRLALTTGLTLLVLVALVRADPGTLYVDGATGSDDSDCSNPAAPCATIGYALTQAVSGDEIRVAGGTYAERLFIDMGIRLSGGYEAAGWTRDLATYETVVDAGGNGTAVMFFAGSAGAMLDGFTVTGGETGAGSDGGGIGIRPDSGVVTISRCTITDNRAGGVGGGIAVARGSAPVILDTRIISNAATLEWGGGVAAYGGSAPTLINVLVADNSAVGGTGGLALDAGTLVNVTVANNTPPGVGVFDTPTYTVAITNSILYGNGGLDIQGANITIGYSDVGQGVLPGPGNISEDPRFVDAANGDYHLLWNSPAIDAGTNMGAPPADLEGDLRPMDGDKDGTATVDMGIDEFLPDPGLIVVKRAAPEEVQPGGQLTYTIYVTNKGNMGLHATITDTLPLSVTLGGTLVPPGGTLTPPGGTVVLPGGRVGVVWTTVLSTPGSGWMGTIHVTVDAGSDGPLSNLVEVTTKQGAAGSARVLVNARRVYLPLVLRAM